MTSSQNKHTGMGVIVQEKGVAFRVWAPHADSVRVIGQFNDWNEEANFMEHEADGYWYADLPNAQAGQEYKYLITNGDMRLPRRDPYARQVTNSVGNSVIYDPNSFNWEGDDYKLPPLNELVIYEMHIGSFFTGEEGRAGDFSTAVQKFDHLRSLGVNVLQVMPVAEFAGDFSWGYNPADIFAVESAYGGPDAYKAFIKEAHKQGFGVIQDVVYNHFGPSDLSLWQFDGWSENGQGGIYFFNDWRAETPWGATRPDYGRKEVRNYIRDNAMMWLEEYHVDGLRADMTVYIRTVHGGEDSSLPEGWQLMASINSEIRQRFPHAITIAEDLHTVSAITQSDLEGGAGFHAQWDANFVHPIRKLVTVSEDAWRSMESAKDAILHNYNNDAFRRVVYSESHDEVANGRARAPQEIDPNDPKGWYAQKRSTLAAGLVLTSPGVPMIFQGQEFLEGLWFRDDMPLDWALNDQFHGIARMYHDLIALRRNFHGNSKGLQGQFTNVFHINEDNGVIAFQRWDQHGPGDDVIVVLNATHNSKQDYVIGLPDAGLWKLRFNSDSRIYSDIFEGFFSSDTEAFEGGTDGLKWHGSVNIGAYSMLVYSKDE
ncbi:MAG TPA: alpha-amylase family glycosyl hydrolase [Bellilinea sp.]|nr:alpha-amylase family glycosyl hydrolase [Bellilinea sp.]